MQENFRFQSASIEEIDKIAQGRVWTGEQAEELGLVDDLGGIELAVRTAAELAGVDSYSVTEVSGSRNFWDELLDGQLGKLRMAIVKDALGDELEYFKALSRAKAYQGIQARIPYDMKPF